MRFGAIGIPELVLILMMAGLWLIPVAAAIWALVTLYRIRESQTAMQNRLNAIEQMLQRR